MKEGPSGPSSAGLTSTLAHSPALPALDWQLPAHSGPYELRIEVQPKSHHRAHYETEGSRGAVKATAGGHPSVQVCVSSCSVCGLGGTQLMLSWGPECW